MHRSTKRYKCLVCGHTQMITTNHTGLVWDYCSHCSWKMYYSERSRNDKYSARFGANMFRRFQYDGRDTYEENPMRLGKREQHALKFIRSVNGWHSYNIHDQTTKRVIKSLKRKGLIEVSGSQFRSK